jgi:hypothetical protein
MVIMKRYGLAIPLILLLAVFVLAPDAHSQTANVQSVVDMYFHGDQAIRFGRDRRRAVPLHYVNMLLLLCAAWIVLYAGLIFLGFGGCRWTSDMAINFYRTVLGVGVTLMTMQLIIGIGVQFLQDLVASASQNLDAGQLGILMCATIILAVISHRLPHMVAGMVVGGGHNGAIGGVGMMTLFAGALTSASLAGRLSGNPAAALAIGGVGEGSQDVAGPDCGCRSGDGRPEKSAEYFKRYQRWAA